MDNSYKSELVLLIVFEKDEESTDQWNKLTEMAQDYPDLVMRYGHNDFDLVDDGKVSFIEGYFALFKYHGENIQTGSEDVINTVQDYGLYAKDIIPVS